MSDKRERPGTGQRVSDEDIDRAAASLVAARPSPQLYARVMRRVTADEGMRPDLVSTAKLRRWQFAFGALAVLFAVTVGIFMKAPDAPRPPVPVARASNPMPIEQPPDAVAVPPAAVPSAARSQAPRLSTRPARESSAELPRVVSRVTGPRLAERVGGARVRATGDLAAPAQPPETTVDVLPRVAPIEVTPLPVPAPLVIPPIVIPEIRVGSK